MKILVVGKFCSEAFGSHIAETLVAMGHSVRRYEPGVHSESAGGLFRHRINQVRTVIHSATDGIPAIRARRMHTLWEIVGMGPLDIVIVCHDMLWPAEVAELKRRTGALVTMWFPDAISNFGRGFFMNAPYDGLFFKDPFIVPLLNDVLLCPVYYLPECFNPAKHVVESDVKRNLEEYRCDITTAGTLHSYRVAFFTQLAEFDVKLWGPPPPLWMPYGLVSKMYQHRYVSDDEKALAFTAAKIVINNLHYAEVWGVNVRTFETAGIGAFQMVDWRPGLHQLFDEGKELISFRNIGDLKQKIRYWLPRDDERRMIAEAAMIRAHKEHTYGLRLSLLLDTLSGAERGFPLPAINR